METIFRIIYPLSHNLFKSYYVVWKLIDKDNCSPLKNSLNRTMQYGNYDDLKVYRDEEGV